MRLLKLSKAKLDYWCATNALMIAAICAATLGLAGWMSGRLPTYLALPILALAGMAIGRVLHRQTMARLKAEQICGDGLKPGRSLMDCLLQIEQRLGSVQHRLSAVHPVTGLPTREQLYEQIDHDIQNDADALALGVIRFVDFDRLAAFDPKVANLALRRFADRLVSALPSGHLINHTDRDCFSILFRNDVGAASAEFRALLYVAKQALDCGEDGVAPRLEAALVRYPQDGATAAELALRSTACLAEAMSATNSGTLESHALVTASAESIRTDYDLEAALAKAIDLDQLSLVYQPVVDLEKGRVISAEALLRWSHPRLGSVSPAQFIPIVERLGLSERFGLWVLNAACREAATWRSQGLDGIKVAVNLSARQLIDQELGDKIRRTLQRHALPATGLELELTETAAMVDAERTRQLFSALRETGLSLAIDDFGSGYSSFSYLKTLPFDKLKIDREFVTGVDQRRDSRAICKALIELGRGLDLVVLAEGVETAAEVATLQELGCSIFQGFYFSKPLSGPSFRDFVREASWTRLVEPASNVSSQPLRDPMPA